MIQHSRPTIEDDDIKAVLRTLTDRQVASGPINLLLVKELKKFFQAERVILTPSGREAIRLALRALKVGRNDEVIIPAYVCASVAWAVEAVGAKPVAVDINLGDYNISYEDTVKKISTRTKAIIVPHLFGNVVKDIRRFLKLRVPIIEDVAQAIGGAYRGKKLGSFADLTICSFYATKVITTGEGGALVVNSGGYEDIVDDKNYFYHMPDLQAALGLSQLKKVGALIGRRAKIFNAYQKELSKVGGVRVATPESIYYRCLIETSGSAAKVVERLEAKGIKAVRYTDTVFNYLRLNPRDYPNTAHATDKAVSIPIYPSLRAAEVKNIIAQLKEITIKK